MSPYAHVLTRAHPRAHRYYTPGAPTLPFYVAGGGRLNPPGIKPPTEPASAIKTLQGWQKFTEDNDKDSIISANFGLEQTIDLAEIYLQIPKI